MTNWGSYVRDFVWPGWGGAATDPVMLGAKMAAAGYRGARRYYKSRAKKTSRRLAFTGRRRVSRRFRRRRYRNRRKRKRRYPLYKKVARLTKMAYSDTGTHIHRRRNAFRVVCGVNATNYVAKAVNNKTIVADILGKLEYYNPSVPGTLTTADGTTGSFMKTFMFRRISCTAVIRNNYTVPVNVDVYFCRVKSDTSIEPDTAVQDGYNNVVGAAAGFTSYEKPALFYPSDSK